MKENVQPSSHIRLTYITHFLCDQPDKFQSIEKLLENFATYPPEVLDLVHFVIVDDGSPIAYEPQHRGLNLTWLRVTENIPWNNPGARNLGVTYAKSENIVISDTDHDLPPETMAYLCRRRDCGKSFFKLKRLDPEGRPCKSHPNLFFMARSRFMKFFGYDEQFCGDYAHDDMWFVKFQKWHGSIQRHLPARYPARMRKLDARKHTHSLARDLDKNETLYQKKRKLVDEHGANYGHSRTFLDFEWKISLFHQRPAPSPKSDRLWKKLWWFRSFNPYYR
jgi:hypothetical protein